MGRPDYGGFCQRSIGDAESKKELLEFFAVVNTRSVQHLGHRILVTSALTNALGPSLDAVYIHSRQTTILYSAAL